jgi:hypothetical protein
LEKRVSIWRTVVTIGFAVFGEDSLACPGRIGTIVNSMRVTAAMYFTVSPPQSDG